MNITVIYNSKKNHSHPEKRNILSEAIGEQKFTYVDMAVNKQLHEIYNLIVASNPQLIVTFDFAGFELRTENDSASLFMIPCRGAHFVFDYNKSSAYFDEEYYLGQYLFVSREYDISKLSSRVAIPDIEYMPQFDEASLKEWFAGFKKEARL